MNLAKSQKVATQEEGKTREGRVTSKSSVVKPLMESLWFPGTLLVGGLPTGTLTETSLLSSMRPLLCLLAGPSLLSMPGLQDTSPDQLSLFCPMLIALAKVSQQQPYKHWRVTGRPEQSSHTP